MGEQYRDENRVVMRYELSGRYSYETVQEPELEFIRSIGQENVDPWLEHVFQCVTPYTTVRLILEVYG
ncbi:hypothetical protein [Alicyclobacillus herbarius]|uniref:hypothetical protein n=1 Tax=Alicyclobacillus herbarius TaxID=122960 RepID=UPI00041AFBF3|nr:hypothetical protein [Alicyclobacillus herbarius]